MILYQDDWYTQSAIPHTTTKNESFIKMHRILKNMGIDNNAFFMALHDKELENIDPHTLKDPSKELATRIGVECTRNPWYYIREIVRLPASGIENIPFQLNRANLFIYWSFFNSIPLYLIQPRQTGKTVTVASLIVYCMYFLYKKTNLFLYTHSNDLIYDNVDRSKSIRDGLPKYLIKPQKLLDVENKSQLEYAAKNNILHTKTAQKAVSAAFTVGRGKTFLVAITDEGPFCSNIQISYPVMMNAENKARVFADENNIPHANIFITTAGVLDTNEGAFSYNMLNRACRFNDSFYDLQDNASLRYVVQKNSKNKMLYAEYSHIQLGYDDRWVEETAIANEMTDPQQIKRDLLNQWTSGTNLPAVPADILEKIDASKEPPTYSETIDGYIFRWYEHPQDIFAGYGRHFVLSMDTSENIGNDFTTLHMLDVSDLSTIMTSRCNDADLLKLADYVADFLIDHPNVTLIPESRSTATVLIPIIIKKLITAGINPFTRIYNKVVQNRTDPTLSKIDINNAALAETVYKKFFGYKTAGTGENSRDTLYRITLRRALTASYAKVRDANLIQEIRSLTTRNGKIDHAIAGHDDTVISYMLAAWLVMFGKNLSVYGIPLELLMCKVTASGAQVDVTIRQRQRDLKKRIQTLKDQIEGTTHPVVKNSLEKELRTLQYDLEESFKQLPDETVTVDTHDAAMRKGMSDADLHKFLGKHYISDIPQPWMI